MPNTLVQIQPDTGDIDRFLAENPVEIYPDPPPLDTRISLDPIPPI